MFSALWRSSGSSQPDVGPAVAVAADGPPVVPAAVASAASGPVVSRHGKKHSDTTRLKMKLGQARFREAEAKRKSQQIVQNVLPDRSFRAAQVFEKDIVNRSRQIVTEIGAMSLGRIHHDKETNDANLGVLSHVDAQAKSIERLMVGQLCSLILLASKS